MNIAKLFSYGGGQAVRLPKGFRFEGQLIEDFIAAVDAARSKT